MRDALLKYACAEVPRYTSYPTAAQFHDGVGADTYRRWLEAIGADDRLSVYMHVPFCRQLCWYCGCHTTIIHDYGRVAAYVKALHREIGLLGRSLPAHGGVTHVHFGGGTPTLLAPGDFAGLIAAMRSAFGFLPDCEIAVEADPRTLDEPTVAALAAAGVGRVSLGVQDFSPRVQERINRVQPVRVVSDACRWLRAAGITAINFDLMYGLPGQSAADAAQTAALAASLRPGRIAVFGYAHVPWFKKHQRVFDPGELPGTAERFDQAETVAGTLTRHGYREIGFDHYALPGDALALAADEGRLKRNFQGYTVDEASVLLGLGASAIGCLPDGYVQNAVGIGDYGEIVAAGRMPVVRGVALTGEDRLRRAAIETVLCRLELDAAALCRSRGFAVDALDDAFAALGPLEDDGLVALSGRKVTVTPQGRRFLRNVAACFDAYWVPREARHSRAV